MELSSSRLIVNSEQIQLAAIQSHDTTNTRKISPPSKGVHKKNTSQVSTDKKSILKVPTKHLTSGGQLQYLRKQTRVSFGGSYSTIGPQSVAQKQQQPLDGNFVEKTEN